MEMGAIRLFGRARGQSMSPSSGREIRVLLLLLCMRQVQIFWLAWRFVGAIVLSLQYCGKSMYGVHILRIGCGMEGAMSCFAKKMISCNK